MSIFIKNYPIFTRRRLQRLWEKGFSYIVYDRKAVCILRYVRSGDFKNGLVLKNKNPDYGMIMLCNLLV